MVGGDGGDSGPRGRREMGEMRVGAEAGSSIHIGKGERGKGMWSRKKVVGRYSVKIVVVVEGKS